jgi:hypothetical protein
MKKIHIIIFVVISIVIVSIVGIYKFNLTNNDIYNKNTTQINIHDGTYIINGQKIILKNGISEIEAAPGSASKIITRYFGNDVVHDLNEDGRDDMVFIVTQETGGSGIFYYVVALLNTANGPVGSAGLLLGDRIAPQTIEIDEGKTTMGSNRKNVIIVNYADRKLGENFSVMPSIGKSIWIKLDPITMQFGEVAQNFEGESI